MQTKSLAKIKIAANGRVKAGPAESSSIVNDAKNAPEERQVVQFAEKRPEAVRERAQRPVERDRREGALAAPARRPASRPQAPPQAEARTRAPVQSRVELGAVRPVPPGRGLARGRGGAQEAQTQTRPRHLPTQAEHLRQLPRPQRPSQRHLRVRGSGGFPAVSAAGKGGEKKRPQAERQQGASRGRQRRLPALLSSALRAH